MKIPMIVIPSRIPSVSDWAAMEDFLKRARVCGLEIEADAAFTAYADGEEYTEEYAEPRRRAALAEYTYVIDQIIVFFDHRKVAFTRRGLRGFYALPVEDFLRDVLAERDSDGADQPMLARWPEDTIGAKPGKPKPNPMPETPPVSERWQRIAKLFGIKNRIGFSPEAVAAAAGKYGAMPETLRSYYLELGAHKALNATQDRLLAPDALRETSAHIVFYEENQSVFRFGIAKADWGKADPPVYRTEGDEAWRREADGLAAFLMAAAHMQAVFSYAYGAEEFIFVTAEGARAIRETFKATGLTYNGMEFFTHSGAIILMTENGNCFDVLYSASDEAAFAELDAKMNKLLARYIGE